MCASNPARAAKTLSTAVSSVVVQYETLRAAVLGEALPPGPGRPAQFVFRPYVPPRRQEAFISRANSHVYSE